MSATMISISEQEFRTRSVFSIGVAPVTEKAWFRCGEHRASCSLTTSIMIGRSSPWPISEANSEASTLAQVSPPKRPRRGRSLNPCKRRRGKPLGDE
jgi:hypothetical protein